MRHTKISRIRKRNNLKKSAAASRAKSPAHGIAISSRRSGQAIEAFSFRSVVLDELGYAKDMFLMPLITVKEAVASGFRRNALEIKKYGRRFSKSNAKSQSRSID